MVKILRKNRCPNNVELCTSFIRNGYFLSVVYDRSVCCSANRILVTVPMSNRSQMGLKVANTDRAFLNFAKFYLLGEYPVRCMLTNNIMELQSTLPPGGQG